MVYCAIFENTHVFILYIHFLLFCKLYIDRMYVNGGVCQGYDIVSDSRLLWFVIDNRVLKCYKHFAERGGDIVYKFVLQFC